MIVHAFDVGHGDSIVIEFPNGSWGVIDCKNDSGDGDSSALSFLKARDVRRLAFVCLTHPHEDHFSGLPQILDHYGDDVDELWMFRIEPNHWKNFLQIQNNAATTARRARQAAQLRQIFQHLTKKLKQGRVYLLDANKVLAPVDGVQIDCLAPHAKELSNYQTSLARWAGHPEQYRVDENRLSAVLRFRYGKSTVLFGSDATKDSWIDIARESGKRGDSIRSNLVKISHHGSTSGFFRGAWELMAAHGTTHGAVSAGAQYGLPDKEVIENIWDFGVRLHCTNYAPSCLQMDELDLAKFEGLTASEKLRLYMLDQSANTKRRTCDGDLHFQIDPQGNVSFAHQFRGLCPYHLPFA